MEIFGSIIGVFIVLIIIATLINNKTLKIVFTDMLDENADFVDLKEPIIRDIKIRGSKAIIIENNQEVVMKSAYTNPNGGLAFKDEKGEYLLTITPRINNKKVFMVTWFFYKKDIQLNGLAQKKGSYMRNPYLTRAILSTIYVLIFAPLVAWGLWSSIDYTRDIFSGYLTILNYTITGFVMFVGIFFLIGMFKAMYTSWLVYVKTKELH